MRFLSGAMIQLGASLVASIRARFVHPKFLPKLKHGLLRFCFSIVMDFLIVRFYGTDFHYRGSDLDEEIPSPEIKLKHDSGMRFLSGAMIWLGASLVAQIPTRFVHPKFMPKLKHGLLRFCFSIVMDFLIVRFYGPDCHYRGSDLDEEIPSPEIKLKYDSGMRFFSRAKI